MPGVSGDISDIRHAWHYELQNLTVRSILNNEHKARVVVHNLRQPSQLAQH